MDVRTDSSGLGSTRHRRALGWDTSKEDDLHGLAAGRAINHLSERRMDGRGRMDWLAGHGGVVSSVMRLLLRINEITKND